MDDVEVVEVGHRLEGWPGTPPGWRLAGAGCSTGAVPGSPRGRASIRLVRSPRANSIEYHGYSAPAERDDASLVATDDAWMLAGLAELVELLLEARHFMPEVLHLENLDGHQANLASCLLFLGSVNGAEPTCRHRGRQAKTSANFLVDQLTPAGRQ